MTHHHRKLALLGTLILLLVLAIALSACKEGGIASPTTNKVTSQLSLQISLRQKQLESPTSQRLAQMQSMGMQAQNLGTQRIYIYLYLPLTPSQAADLQALGITLYPDSWMPPSGNNRIGFMLADMPVDKLNDLAAKGYIVSLDTAEKSSQPRSDI